MLIKEKDKNQQQVDYLTDLLERDLPGDKKQLVERELRCIRCGDKGEKTSSYYLDFDFKLSKNWALIHDLRIEHNGDVAQIDHLLIGRMMDIYVIESKNFSSGVAISDDGDFSYFYNNRPCAIPSPIAQNDRHIKLLDRFLTDNDLFPKRLGVAIKPVYRNIVLISPESRLSKPKKGLYDCSAVMKADKFSAYFAGSLNYESMDSLISITKVISTQSLSSFAQTLAFSHEPIVFDFKAKFGISDQLQRDVPERLPENDVSCPKCGKAMVRRVVKTGKNIGKEFWGCSVYPKCKGVVDITTAKSVERSAAKATELTAPLCPDCHKPMLKRISTKGRTKGNEFWGCSDYPQCKATMQIDKELAEKPFLKNTDTSEIPDCPKCHEPMVKRASKKAGLTGKEFWGCSKFPKCRAVISIE
ncbi:MAG: topoisomerase DNA-binding C4 zinc finger domain-containing protein [Gammaproteobacteria bacterium]|nr:topoisomerase DNA-binding C4 zinc finger domain-containing protein [Gammaproteobacteria bacterium]